MKIMCTYINYVNMKLLLDLFIKQNESTVFYLKDPIIICSDIESHGPGMIVKGYCQQFKGPSNHFMKCKSTLNERDALHGILTQT